MSAGTGKIKGVFGPFRGNRAHAGEIYPAIGHVREIRVYDTNGFGPEDGAVPSRTVVGVLAGAEHRPKGPVAFIIYLEHQPPVEITFVQWFSIVQLT